MGAEKKPELTLGKRTSLPLPLDRSRGDGDCLSREFKAAVSCEMERCGQTLTPESSYLSALHKKV